MKTPLIVIGLYLLHVLSLSAINNAVEIGGDEAVEFNKAFFYLHHGDLINLMWNDQPFLYTAVLRLIMKCCADYVFIARVLTLILSIGLVIGSTLMLRSTDKIGKCVCVLTLLTWPAFMKISMSAMLEPVAIALGVIAAAVSLTCNSHVAKWRAVLSSIIMALAVNIKLTALICLPPLLISLMLREIYFGARERKTLSKNVFCMINLWLLYSIVFFIAAVAVYEIMPQHILSLSIKSHFMASMTHLKGHPLSNTEAKIPGLLLGLVCIVITSRDRRFIDVVYPLTFLLSSVLTHLLYSPWWFYYEIHFAVPISMLAGKGASYLFEIERDRPGEVISSSPLNRLDLYAKTLVYGWRGVFATAWIASYFALQLPRYFETAGTISKCPRVESQYLLKELKKYSSSDCWIYSDVKAFAHYSGLAFPPELVVVPLKRVWTAQINDNDIVKIARNYKPGQIVLNHHKLTETNGWAELLGKEYVLVGMYDDYNHYVRNSFNPQPIGKIEEDKRAVTILKRLGWIE